MRSCPSDPWPSPTPMLTSCCLACTMQACTDGGADSERAVELLQGAGFSQAVQVQGGFRGWTQVRRRPWGVRPHLRVGMSASLLHPCLTSAAQCCACGAGLGPATNAPFLMAPGSCPCLPQIFSTSGRRKPPPGRWVLGELPVHKHHAFASGCSCGPTLCPAYPPTSPTPPSSPAQVGVHGQGGTKVRAEHPRRGGEL